MAAGAHAALFVLTPAIEGAAGWLEGPTERPGMEVVALEDLPSPAEASGTPTLLERAEGGDGAADGDESNTEEEADEPHEDSEDNPSTSSADEEGAAGVGRGGGGDEAGSDALRHRLRAEAPEPDLVEAEKEEDRDSEEAAAEGEDAREGQEEEREGVDIEGDPAALDADDLPDADELDLDRLVGESPEIAIQAPSHWVLVENPEDVRKFIEEAYESERLEDGKEGGVLVTLWIDEIGSVEWAEVARSSGDRGMDAVAVELFDDVVSFRPARDQGVRVPVSVQFWLHFPWRY